MDIQNFNKKLNKITALSENSVTDGDLSSLEKDLLLSYIRDLYEIVLDSKQIEKQIKPAVIKAQMIVEPTIVENVTKQVEEKIAVLPNVSDVIEEKLEQSVKHSEIQVDETGQSPVMEIKSKPVPVQVKQQNSDALAEMFADDKINDLSDKLALTPVKDLTKSMGINERIFTQQELFGNDNQVFTNTLQNLNNCQNFDEAKQYLLDNVIYNFDWTNDSKLKKASTFVKLVKRKFS